MGQAGHSIGSLRRKMIAFPGRRFRRSQMPRRLYLKMACILAPRPRRRARGTAKAIIPPKSASHADGKISHTWSFNGRE